MICRVLCITKSANHIKVDHFGILVTFHTLNNNNNKSTCKECKDIFYTFKSA